MARRERNRSGSRLADWLDALLDATGIVQSFFAHIFLTVGLLFVGAGLMLFPSRFLTNSKKRKVLEVEF